MPTIKEILDSKALSNTEAKAIGGLIQSMPEHGTLDVVIVSGGKQGALFIIENPKAAVTYALRKLTNAFALAKLRGNTENPVAFIDAASEMGFAVVFSGNEKVTNTRSKVEYQVKRHNNLVVGKNGVRKKRTVVKFLLELGTPESTSIQNAILELGYVSTNGYKIVTVDGDPVPVCSLHYSEKLVAVSVEI